MHRLRTLTGAVALLVLASTAVADAPTRTSAAPVAICPASGGSCPMPCGPCPEPCPMPCADQAGTAGQASQASLR
jgi:hypothetical protein